MFLSEPFDIDKSLIINIPTVGLAGATLLLCLISYIWTPKKLIFPTSLLIYLLLTATTAYLVISTGDISSPFVPLWMLVSIFAGVFGLWGLLPILATVSVFIALQYFGNNFTTTTLIITIFSGISPLIASLIIWHGKSNKDEVDSDNKAYRSLANELSTVASKSEVVINAIGDGVIVIDSQGVVQLINPAAQTIIGWNKQDALALNYKSVFKLVNQKDEVLDPLSDPIQQALNSNQEIRTNNLSLITSSGNKIMLSLVASPVGVIGSGVITVFHDVTKEKAEEREQTEFISTASHEMRTPVASIEGYLGLAINPHTATIDERARDFIMKAHASAEHLGHLFQDLLDVTKTEDGRLPNKPNVVNIVLLVHDIVQGLKQNATSKGLDLVFKPMPDSTTERFIAPAYFVNLDNDHIREVINNLVENAIKYTLKGQILIDISGDDDRVIISVKDSGIGIPAEDITHLFQKFYRVDNKDTREIGGTGLGLYLCRRLVEMMGGRIWIESIYTVGSTFFVELPRISSQEASRLSEQEAIFSRQEADKKAETLLAESTPFAVTSAELMTDDTKPIMEIPATVIEATEPEPIVHTPTPIMNIQTPAVKPIITKPIIVIQEPIKSPTPVVKPVPPPVIQPVEPIPITVIPPRVVKAIEPTPVKDIRPPIRSLIPPPITQSASGSQSLTSEQIAAYVIKQRTIAQQQAAHQLSRPRPTSVPVRDFSNSNE